MTRERFERLGSTTPDRITVCQRSIKQASEHGDGIMVTVGQPIIHERSYYFGLSEEELEAIEAHYWHSHVDEPR